jgi:dihydroorotase
MRRALRAAERAGAPLLVGTRRHPDWSLDDQLEWLRPGDVVTYAFHSLPEGILDESGRVRRSVWKARERGIRFDLGHGRRSFSFAVAERALAEGFAPDTVSSDAQRGHEAESPLHDLPLTLSKLLAAGMERDPAFRAVTIEPARILGLDSDRAGLLPGRRADLVYLRQNPGAAPLTDAVGGSRGGVCWETAAVVRGGRMVFPRPPDG